MGTMLYGKGIFINRCFESLNLSQPELVAGVHREYLAAGADVLETNTFGASRMKLRGFGLGDQVREINLAGARLAREVAGDGAYVAGRDRAARRAHRALGQDRRRRGARVLPRAGRGAGRGRRRSARSSRRSATGTRPRPRSRPLASAVHAADRRAGDDRRGRQQPRRHAARAVRPGPGGARRRRRRRELQRRAGADARDDRTPVGGVRTCRCRRSPTPASRATSRAATSISARRSTWPRTPGASSPAACAWWAAAAGRRPSTSARSRWRSSNWRPTSKAASPGARARSPWRRRTRGRRSPPRATSRALGAALAAGRFVVGVEVVPPRGHDTAQAVVSGADAGGARPRPGDDLRRARAAARGWARLALAVLIQQHAGLEPLLQYSCRDRNLLGIQSDLLGAHAMGVRNLLGITGDVRRIGDYPDATAVFDVDSIGLHQRDARGSTTGSTSAGQPIGEPTALLRRGHGQPGGARSRARAAPVRIQGGGGAEFAVTRPIFDVAAFERFLAEDCALPRPDPGRAVVVRIGAECRIHGQRGAGRRRPGRAGRADAGNERQRGRADEGTRMPVICCRRCGR